DADHPTGPVLATARYDAWIVRIAPGCLWHLDPERGAGAIHVVSGELLEDWHGERGPVPRTVAPGDTIGLGWSGHRRIVNVSSRPVVAVHVSSPPLGSQLERHDDLYRRCG